MLGSRTPRLELRWPGDPVCLSVLWEGKLRNGWKACSHVSRTSQWTQDLTWIEVHFHPLYLDMGPVVPRPCLDLAGDGLRDPGHLWQETGLCVASS